MTLLLGGSSIVGAAIRSRACSSFNLRWTWHKSVSTDLRAFQLDLLNPDSVATAIQQFDPARIVDATIVMRDSRHHSDRAARNICRALGERRNHIRYIRLSSDVVFDGNAECVGYSETDSVSPITDYGRSLVAAEKIFLEEVPNCVVARTSVVFGLDYRSANLRCCPRVDKVISALSTGKPIACYANQFRTPTYLEDLVTGILQLGDSSFSGIIHIAGSSRCSRLEFAREIAGAFGYDRDSVKVQTTPMEYKYGRDTSLCSDLARIVLNWSPLDVAEAMCDLRKRLTRITTET